MTCPDPRPITSFLQEERLNAGKSRAALAREIGVSERVLRLAEIGVTPRPANALKIADYYGRTVVDMWPPEQNGEAA